MYFVQTRLLETFLQVLNMSLTASVIIAFVLAARLLLKKAPKIYSYVLWSVVLFRLLCPVSFESMFSLLPVNANPISLNTLHSETPQISTGIVAVDNRINPILPAPEEGRDEDNPLRVAANLGVILWLMGIAVLFIHSMVSLLRLRKKLIGAVKLRDNIFLADHIASPFVMGMFRPKIYLPSTLQEQEQSYIILHEQTHIRRFDPGMKFAAFIALCIHWFNPLVWIAFSLAVNDMEMSCDESVMKRLGASIREEYLESLLSLATGRKIASTPLAFGEGDTKSRIKNILCYKKPAFWVTVAALTAVAVTCIAFAFNPQRASMEWAKNLRLEEVEKIELVVMPSDENEQYHLFDRSEYLEVVALVNQSRGRYLPNPEPLAGGSIMYYITTTDGVRHEFGNNGNSYLTIDKDAYKAGYEWLSSWDHQKGDTPLPETFLFGNERLLTLEELKVIAKKGEDISWEDFEPYHGKDIGSGLYIMYYPLEQPYSVIVGGVPNKKPMYINLSSNKTKQYIDIRQESIDEFIETKQYIGISQESEEELFQDAEVEPIIFWVKPDETLQAIGKVAALEWLDRYKDEKAADNERITDYSLYSVKVISCKPEANQTWQEMPYQYVVCLEYSITTATQEYRSPVNGISGKGLFEGLYIELSLKDLGRGNYEVVGVGTSQEK